MQTADVLSKLNLLGSAPAPRVHSPAGTGGTSESASTDLLPVQTVGAGAQVTGVDLPAADKSGKKSEERGEVTDALQNVNAFFQEVQRTLEFKLNEDTGRMIVEIKDVKTNEVIRQIPAKEVIQLAKRLDELRGLLFEDKA